MHQGKQGGILPLLSQRRIDPYLAEARGDTALATQLYAWNVDIAAACWEVLAYLEVILRNAMDRELAIDAGEQAGAVPWFRSATMTGAASAGIARDIAKVEHRIRKAGGTVCRDHIVAGVDFGFWTRLFAPAHEQLWVTTLHRALPGAHAGKRKSVWLKLERLRPFRNRLAHHDSLLNQDVPLLLEEMLTLIEWVSPDARSWLEQRHRVSEIFSVRPVMAPDVLVVPAEFAWPLYQHVHAYICPAGRNFRPVDYIAFYADKEIKPAVGRILHHRENVEWSSAEADRLRKPTGVASRFDRWVADVITTSRMMGPWDEGRYQVFLLTKDFDGDRHIALDAAIPHLASGRGSAYVQRHRYISHHSLRIAADTTQLR